MQQADESGVSVVPIAGAANKKRAISNMGAVTVNNQDEENWKVLNSMAEGFVGERYNASFMRVTIEAQTKAY